MAPSQGALNLSDSLVPVEVVVVLVVVVVDSSVLL
jgi:hypothetical protein